MLTTIRKFQQCRSRLPSQNNAVSDSASCRVCLLRIAHLRSTEPWRRVIVCKTMGSGFFPVQSVGLKANRDGFVVASFVNAKIEWTGPIFLDFFEERHGAWNPLPSPTHATRSSSHGAIRWLWALWWNYYNLNLLVTKVWHHCTMTIMKIGCAGFEAKTLGLQAWRTSNFFFWNSLV